jgi:NAD-dependent dihydropyrimidine dehydrogenase PreA subunit
MAKFKIVQKVADCIGCGACISVCPANWELKGDKAKPKKTDLDALGCNQQASDACPVQCIKILKK